MHRSTIALAVAALCLLTASAYGGTKLRGWVTQVDESTQTVKVDGQSISLKGLDATGGHLDPGVFVKVERGRIKVKPQRPPADDQVVHFPAKDPRNPGRVSFSHLRHFNALGDKQCKTCHSPEMKLRADSPPGATPASTASEPHGAASRGRFCATCHDGKTPLPKNGPRTASNDAALFTTATTGNPTSCQRCHTPADHGRDFTPMHGEQAEHGRATACRGCHRQDWTTRDRQLQSDLLAAERVRQANPDDSQAALAVGPNNFCVYCHRADAKWR